MHAPLLDWHTVESVRRNHREAVEALDSRLDDVAKHHITKGKLSADERARLITLKVFFDIGVVDDTSVKELPKS